MSLVNLTKDIEVVLRLLTREMTRCYMWYSINSEFHYVVNTKVYDAHEEIKFEDLDSSDAYGSFVNQHQLSIEERALMALSMLYPYERLSFQVAVGRKLEEIKKTSAHLGLILNEQTSRLQPTIQTWLFICAPRDGVRQMELLGKLPNFNIIKNNIINLFKNDNSDYTDQLLLISDSLKSAFYANKSLGEIEVLLEILNESNLTPIA